MEISTLVGNICYPKDKTIQYENKGEKFYLVDLAFNGYSIPAVCSEYLLKDIEGRASVKGYISSTYHHVEGKRKLFTFFYITDLEKVSGDTEFSDMVKLDIVLTKIGKFKISDKNGRAYLPLVGKCYIGYKKSAIIHMLASETNARQLKDCKVDDRIVATGYIHQRGVPIQVVLADVVSIHRKEGTSDV